MDLGNRLLTKKCMVSFNAKQMFKDTKIIVLYSDKCELITV